MKIRGHNRCFICGEDGIRAYFKIDDRFQCMGVLVSSLNRKFLGREICAEFLKVMPVNEEYGLRDTFAIKKVRLRQGVRRFLF